jgi:sec-independent protein translocase protein TatC
MTVLEHIAELRSTLIWALGLAFGAAILAWFFSDPIVDELLRPAREAGQETLYFQAPMDAFLLKLKASGVVGGLLVLPLVMYKIYAFVLPGLHPHEKRMVTPLLVTATLLFYVGVGFCFVVLLPLVIKFMLGFQTEHLVPWINAGSYFDMAARLCLAFGLLFELPMVVFALSWVGVVNPRTLLKGWRYALVLILAVSAMLTPPDVISQVLLAGPVMLLYLASVLISMAVRRRRDQRRALALAEEEDAAGDEDPDDDPDPPEGGGGGSGTRSPNADSDPLPARPRRAPGSLAQGEDPGEERPEAKDAPDDGPEAGGN